MYPSFFFGFFRRSLDSAQQCRYSSQHSGCPATCATIICTPVEIDKAKFVSEHKDAIKDEMGPKVDDIPANSLFPMDGFSVHYNQKPQKKESPGTQSRR